MRSSCGRFVLVFACLPGCLPAVGSVWFNLITKQAEKIVSPDVLVVVDQIRQLHLRERGLRTRKRHSARAMPNDNLDGRIVRIVKGRNCFCCWCVWWCGCGGVWRNKRRTLGLLRQGRTRSSCWRRRKRRRRRGGRHSSERSRQPQRTACRWFRGPRSAERDPRLLVGLTIYNGLGVLQIASGQADFHARAFVVGRRRLLAWQMRIGSLG